MSPASRILCQTLPLDLRDLRPTIYLLQRLLLVHHGITRTQGSRGLSHSVQASSVSPSYLSSLHTSLGEDCVCDCKLFPSHPFPQLISEIACAPHRPSISSPFHHHPQACHLLIFSSSILLCTFHSPRADLVRHSQIISFRATFYQSLLSTPTINMVKREISLDSDSDEEVLATYVPPGERSPIAKGPPRKKRAAAVLPAAAVSGIAVNVGVGVGAGPAGGQDPASVRKKQRSAAAQAKLQLSRNSAKIIFGIDFGTT